jgi:putative endonuclease
MNDWTLYILRCKDKSLYTGITKDLVKRIEQHNAGLGAKYTRGRGPCELIWSQGEYSESEAKQEEYRIKKLSRKEKESLTRINSLSY